MVQRDAMIRFDLAAPFADAHANRGLYLYYYGVGN